MEEANIGEIMKYCARPVEVEAFQITRVEQIFSHNSDTSEYKCYLDDGSDKIATAEMCARYIPKQGDYYVIQSDGYSYLNPQHVFIRKYERVA